MTWKWLLRGQAVVVGITLGVCFAILAHTFLGDLARDAAFVRFYQGYYFPDMPVERGPGDYVDDLVEEILPYLAEEGIVDPETGRVNPPVEIYWEEQTERPGEMAAAFFDTGKIVIYTPQATTLPDELFLLCLVHEMIHLQRGIYSQSVFSEQYTSAAALEVLAHMSQDGILAARRVVSYEVMVGAWLSLWDAYPNGEVFAVLAGQPCPAWLAMEWMEHHSEVMKYEIGPWRLVAHDHDRYNNMAAETLPLSLLFWIFPGEGVRQ